MKILNLDTPNKKLIFYLFFISNIILYFIYIFNDNLGGDLSSINNININTLSISLIIVIFSFIFVNYAYNTIKKIKFLAKVTFINQDESYVIHFIALFFILFNIFATYTYGYGIVGFDSENVPVFIVLINKFFAPLFIIEIYFFYCFNSNKLIYFTNIILFLMLTIYKGYTGPIIHIAFLFIYRSYFRRRLNIKMIFFLVIMGISISPIIRIIKNIMIRSFITGDGFFEELDVLYKISEANNFGELYYIYLQRVFERFELISATYYILEKTDTIKAMYDSNQFLPFYLYHWIPQTLEKILMPSPIFDITQESAQRMIAYLINPYFSWQVHMGFAGWIIISPLESLSYILYVVILMFIATQLTKLLDSNSNSIEQLTWLLVLSFITHGWYNDFILYVQGLFIFTLLILSLNLIKKPKVKFRL